MLLMNIFLLWKIFPWSGWVMHCHSMDNVKDQTNVNDDSSDNMNRIFTVLPGNHDISAILDDDARADNILGIIRLSMILVLLRFITRIFFSVFTYKTTHCSESCKFKAEKREHSSLKHRKICWVVYNSPNRFKISFDPIYVEVCQPLV